MDRLKNKNTVILIISGVLIVIALIVALTAVNGGKNKTTKKDAKTTTSESISVNLSEIAAKNTTEPTKSYVFNIGTYKIATKDDSLNLRLEPNTDSDRITYIPNGEEVKVIAVWEDWGYVVYGQSGGWLSMNYLELVKSSSDATTTTANTTNAQ